MKCVICGKQIEGWGNNPWPVKDTGECCDECNWSAVVPARLKLAEASKTSSQTTSGE